MFSAAYETSSSSSFSRLDFAVVSFTRTHYHRSRRYREHSTVHRDARLKEACDVQRQRQSSMEIATSLPILRTERLDRRPSTEQEDVRTTAAEVSRNKLRERPNSRGSEDGRGAARAHVYGNPMTEHKEAAAAAAALTPYLRSRVMGMGVEVRATCPERHVYRSRVSRSQPSPEESPEYADQYQFLVTRKKRGREDEMPA